MIAKNLESDFLRNRQTRPSTEKGFTLIELMVTVVVLAVGLLALAQMGVMAIQTNKSTSEYAIATRLATNKIDVLKKTTYADLIPNNYVDPNNPMNSEEKTGEAFSVYSRSWVIASGSTSGTKKIKVEVSWSNGSKKVTLNSLVAEGGS
jgi:type IV pilus assembly protein PilV